MHPYKIIRTTIIDLDFGEHMLNYPKKLQRLDNMTYDLRGCLTEYPYKMYLIITF